MNILFLHRNFPAQFRHLATALANNPKNKVVFITNDETKHIKGVGKLIYKVNKEVPSDCHPYLRDHEDALIHGQSAATLTQDMKNTKFIPDIIYTQPFGPGLFMKYIFPDVPVIYYGEWFNRAEGPEITFDETNLDEDFRAKIRCSNSTTLIDLYSCDACITATNWQKQQFPEGFQSKIEVIPDGIDTDTYKPESNAKFLLEDENLELSANDEVVSYSTQGLDPYRGIAQFMQAVEILQQKRPNTHFVIVKEDETHYRQPIGMELYQDLDLTNFSLDMSKVHFVGSISPAKQLKLLQISSVHTFLTYPHILSETLLKAMSTRCCVVASNTAPVQEVVKNNYNGLLCDFFNAEQIAEKIEYALDNRDKINQIGENARKTIIENYSLDKVLPKQINFINNLRLQK